MPYRNVRLSSAERFWTCWLLAGRWRLCLLILVCRIRRSTGWRRQDGVDRGLQPGLSSSEKEELRAARRRIAELETELAVTRQANELLKAQVVSPKGSCAKTCLRLFRL